jgi:hypothetical protein
MTLVQSLQVVALVALLTACSKQDGVVTQSTPDATANSPATESSIDYRDVKAVVLDTENAVGKNIAFDAAFVELGVDGGRPAMFLRIDTSTSLKFWYVFFDKSFSNEVASLSQEQQVSVTCKIVEIRTIVRCSLISMVKS